MALCCIRLPSKPLKNKFFAILLSTNTTKKHKQYETMLRDHRRTKHGNILQSKLQTVLCTRTFFCMHHLKQGGLGRTRWQKMHTINSSPGSPQKWKLFLWQELLNLPETHTATDHKGTSPFPKEGRSKAPAHNTAMANQGISTRQARTGTSNCSNKTNSLYYKVINVQVIQEHISHTVCQRTVQH